MKKLYIIAGLALLVGLYFILKPGEPSGQIITPPPTTVPEVKTFDLVIQDRKLVSGPGIITLTEGDEVKITITSDEADEWHLHGYDKSVDLEIGQTVQIILKVDITGRFVYELEHSHTDIGVIEVQPKN